MERHVRDSAGHAGSRGFFRGNGAGIVGHGLRHTGDQRRRWRAEPYGDPVEAFETIRHPGLRFCEQNGSGCEISR